MIEKIQLLNHTGLEVTHPFHSHSVGENLCTSSAGSTEKCHPRLWVAPSGLLHGVYKSEDS